MRPLKNYKVVVGCMAVLLSACSILNNDHSTAKASLEPARLFSLLPDNCPTPDAFAIAPDNSLTLSCPNYADASKPGVLLRLARDGSVSLLGTISGPNNKGRAQPMGLAYAPDGSLFVVDNQGKNQGRILKITIMDGVIANTEVVAQGMSSPNGIRYYKGKLYVTQLRLPKFKTPVISSGIYYFNETDRNVHVASDGTSPNLIFSALTKNPDRQFGLDGLAFDKAGYLYVSNLGDDEIYKLTLTADGRSVSKTEVYANTPKGTGPDGIAIDEQGNLYLAGFTSNQIIKVDGKGRVSVIAQYADNDGSNGQIDQPADLIVYENQLIISNFDLMKGKGIVNKGHSKPYTISAIDL